MRVGAYMRSRPGHYFRQDRPGYGMRGERRRGWLQAGPPGVDDYVVGDAGVDGVMQAEADDNVIAEPGDQLDSDPAAHGRQHRPGDGVHVRQEASQLHLAGMPRPIPAGQLRLDTLPQHACRAAVHHGHGSHRRARRCLGATSRYPSKVRARSGMQMTMVILPFRGSPVREDHGAKLPFRHNPVLNLGRHAGRGLARISQAHEAEQAGVCSEV